MLSVAMLLAMQAASDLITAPKPEDPATWVLEYPAVIEPYIDDYYGCLRSRGHTSSAVEDPMFEDQHRAHIPLCAKQLAKAQAASNDVLDGRKGYAEYTPERIAATFKTIEFIHVARGRDIDNRLRLHLDQYSTYDAAYLQTPDEAGRGQTRDAVVPEASDEAKRQAIAPNKPQNEVTPNAEN
ncbi:MAG: hypothetical protein ABJ242_03930 [Marinomonas sp.]